MTLPLDPTRCAALSHGIEALIASSPCDTFEVFAVLLAEALNHGRTLPGPQQAQLVLALTDALELTVKPKRRRRLDA